MSTAKEITLGQPGRVTFRKAIIDLPPTVEVYVDPNGEHKLKVRELLGSDSNLLPSRFETRETHPITHISLEEFQAL